MLLATATFLGWAIPITSGVLGGLIGLWIGAKLPISEGWLRRRLQRMEKATSNDHETVEARKRAHEIARRLYPELVR